MGEGSLQRNALLQAQAWLERQVAIASGEAEDLPDEDYADVFNAVMALIEAALEETEEPSGWQPIETAPRDGSTIILHGPLPDNPARVTAGFWCAPEHGKYLGDCGGECRCPEYDDAPEPCWMSDDGGFTDEYPPTQWMPLPPAPQGEG